METTYKTVCEEGKLKFIDFAKASTKLKSNQYFALMVVDHDFPRNHSPHVKGVDPTTHEALIGVERTSINRQYISKDFYKRSVGHRGTTIIVEPMIEVNDENYCIL